MEKSVKNKKRRKKLKMKQNHENNVKLVNETNFESSKTSSVSMKKSVKHEESRLGCNLSRNKRKITSQSDESECRKKKMYTDVNYLNGDATNNSVGEGSEVDIQSSSDNESDISDGESANSVSSFNIDSYPSDDEDEEEVVNKKHGLPVGATPSTELEERENRTIFVGNLPKTVERHELRKWFSRFGKVECVRLRSAPIADLEMPKKVAVIKKSFHENRSNIHAYIRYKDVEGALNALQANSTKYGEYTLRVDHARHKGGYDGKKAVFVGNVPFNIEENSLINLFSTSGEIDGVRIIRDKQTGVGKGFAYVNFKCSSSVPLALKLDGEFLDKRQLRVKPVKYVKKSNKPFSNFSPKINSFKFKSASRYAVTEGRGEMKKHNSSRKPQMKKHNSSRKPPFNSMKFQGEFSKQKERSKFKKKSSVAKKHEKYSKILANKKKTD